MGSGCGSWVHCGAWGGAANEWQMAARGGEWHAMKFQSDRHAAKTFVRSSRLSVQEISSTHAQMRSTRARMAYLQKPRAAVGSNGARDAHAMTRAVVCWSPSGVELCIVLIAVAELHCVVNWVHTARTLGESEGAYNLWCRCWPHTSPGKVTAADHKKVCLDRD